MDAVLSCPNPLGSSPSSLRASDLQVPRVLAAWGRGEYLPLAPGGGAVQAAGWCGARGARPSQEGGEERVREVKQAEELPCQFAEMLL